MKQGMSSLAIFGIVIGVILLFSVMWFVGSYNGLVNSDVTTANAWSKVETAYQRRADLIPNLVEIVKGSKNFEQETLTKIAELRSQAGQAKINVNNANDIASLQAAGTQMNGVLSRLMVIVEAYPDLKSTEAFRDLMSQLEGTENRIKYERDEYNNAVQSYQIKTRRFPTSIIANMFGFDSNKWKMFAADEGSEKAPKISFN